MKAHVYSLEGEIQEEIELPSVFETEYRPDIIKRAVLSCISQRIQKRGTKKDAGKRHVVHYLGTNRGISRTPRMASAGRRAAFVPQAVGGRRAHPPKVEKVYAEKINKKEKQLAIRSAIAMSANQEIVKARGHRIEEVKEIPLIVEDSIEELEKTQEVRDVFLNLGAWSDCERARKRKIRSGKGKMRGRKYKKKKGPLLVVTTSAKSARNLPGVDVVTVENLGPEHLAPGTHPGRFVIWTKSAVKALEGVP
ncbi:MAG: 50S ribosomal protein L4 [Theionarchaea archaeon]|nr:MAG: 50S ribosomal protein L4 [Theionarchaea archaeon DG-70-1]MBU7026848.1 50S ribosomal protein L4 [Theionarchaea archaeon]